MEWLKNEEPLDSPNDDGSESRGGHNLIVSEARLFDSGNYTCVASNIVARRRSATAAVVVYGEESSFWIQNNVKQLRCLYQSVNFPSRSTPSSLAPLNSPKSLKALNHDVFSLRSNEQLMGERSPVWRKQGGLRDNVYKKCCHARSADAVSVPFKAPRGRKSEITMS